MNKGIDYRLDFVADANETFFTNVDYVYDNLDDYDEKELLKLAKKQLDLLEYQINHTKMTVNERELKKMCVFLFSATDVLKTLQKKN